MYLCGPFALKYALVMLGKMEDEKEIEALAGSTWWYGTDEIGLEKAANHYDCDLISMESTGNTGEILKSLKSNLKNGLPAILCVDKWGHWITVIKYEKNKFICVDSGERRVIILLAERELLRRWKYNGANNIPTYSWYVLKPWYKTRTKAKMNIDVAKQLMSPKYKDLALKWDSYFNVLKEVTRSKNPSSEYTITFKEFLRRNQKMMIELVADWQGEIEYRELDIVIENFLFVANVYDMVIHFDDEKTALITFSSVLMMYATKKYGTYSDL
jgi:hypothetical protein